MRSPETISGDHLDEPIAYRLIYSEIQFQVVMSWPDVVIFCQDSQMDVLLVAFAIEWCIGGKDNDDVVDGGTQMSSTGHPSLDALLIEREKLMMG